MLAIQYNSSPQPLLAPGTGFVEDHFSTDGRWGDGSGGNARDGEQQMKLCSPAAHLLLRGPAPNRPRTGTGPRPEGWGPLQYNTYLPVEVFPLFLQDSALQIAFS